jgi:hypothetical protein
LISGITSSQINNYNVLRGYDYYVTLNINDINKADGRFSKGEAEVGDFLCSDGSIVSVDDLSSSGKTPIAIVFSTETSATDQAHGWTHGYAMALKNVHDGGETGTYIWSSSNVDVVDIPNTPHNTWFDTSSDLDGYTHTTYLNSPDYPAGYAAKTTYASQVPPPVNTSGWFLPSIGQLYWILVNLGGMSSPPEYEWSWRNMSSTAASNLNSKLSRVGSGNYDAFFSNTSSTEFYWSSSEAYYECANGALFEASGDMYISYYAVKSAPLIVRPVIAF